MTQPVSPALRAWVVAQLAIGHSPAALRISMRDAGWQDDAAEAALAEVFALAGAAPIERSASEDRPKALPGPNLEGSPLHVDAGDRQVQIMQTMRHPRVVVFGNSRSVR